MTKHIRISGKATSEAHCGASVGDFGDYWHEITCVACLEAYIAVFDSPFAASQAKKQLALLHLHASKVPDIESEGWDD